MIKKKASNKSVVYVILFILFFVSLFSLKTIQANPKGNLLLKWTQNIQLPDRINCQMISYTGNLVGIGTMNGFCYVFDTTGKKIFEKKLKDPVLSIKFSFNDRILYIKSYTLIAVDLTQKKVLWEKFKKDFQVEDFWLFRDGRSGILLRSTKDITKQYLYLDQKGQTIKETTLPPEIYGNYLCTPSVDGKFLLVSLQEGDLYLIQSDGILAWNIHLDPPLKEGEMDYPIFQTVSKDGSVCLAYTADEYGKVTHICQLIDNKSNILWKKTFSSKINNLALSPDEKKISVSLETKLLIYNLQGKVIFSLDQFGYIPIETWIGSTNILIGFISSDQTQAIKRNFTIFKLFSLNQKEVLWQKHTGKNTEVVSLAKNGYVFLLCSSQSVMYYKYELK